PPQSARNYQGGGSARFARARQTGRRQGGGSARFARARQTGRRQVGGSARFARARLMRGGAVRRGGGVGGVHQPVGVPDHLGQQGGQGAELAGSPLGHQM